jgi:hypothetical protein
MGADMNRLIIPRERQMQQTIAEALRLGLPPDCFYTAIPGGDRQATTTPGYRAGTPDWLFLYRRQILLIEQKREKFGVVSKDQQGCHRAIEAAGGATAVAYDLRDIVDILRKDLQCPVNLRIA